ncbi:GTPase HflX [Odoribacter sp. Z80]|jgi:GTP-binding protein HflX|uniref:GTPase HflX n=1 Tax=Odoribacter sp. Z80 TaxID=2304575 RepID=UPI00137AAA1A|nr:GTPase HflX [Odoribacter sp. Z80]NCE72554.1 GTPase HflX [Odoribacter sp. Z80]
MYSTGKEAEKAILVGVALQSKGVGYDRMSEYLEELSFLAETAGAQTVRIFTQNLDKPVHATFIGKGKLEEIKAYTQDNEVDMLIFDDELSPTQLRNIEAMFPGIKILDRTNLILDIFASRARTAHAKTQVELAQYQYLLPRLAGMWTHLERQKGGIGLRGPGETEIETDRRIIRDKITRLKEELSKIDKQKVIQRKNRGKLVRVALVGYTNVGKSTLMNLLSKSDVFAENKLFATLDTTVRKIAIRNVPFLLADTVGFIRKLPHHLIESFKSTLDEVREADVILHVIDISHPQFEDQMKVVNETLSELLKEPKPTILVFNKIDAFQYIKKEDDDLTPVKRENYSLEDLKQMWMSKQGNETVYISAAEKKNIEELKEKLYNLVKEIHSARFPYNDFLYQDYGENETEE